MKSIAKFSVIFALAAGTFFISVPSAQAATLRSEAMATAKTQLGAKYHYGAAGPKSKGYDCSGLTQWSYKKHGKKLPRTAQAQYNKSHHISPKNRKPGDLIFIEDRHNHVYHVGIFTGVKHGKGYMINANSGKFRGPKVVEAPVSEYTKGSPHAVYGRY